MATRRKPARPRKPGSGLVPVLRDAVAVVDDALAALKPTRALRKARAKRRKP